MLKLIIKFLAASTFIFIVTSCKNDITQTMKVPGIDLSQMDTTVKPTEDIYNFVNGTWMRETEIPEDQTRWGGFNILRESTDQDMLHILEQEGEKESYTKGSDQWKALALFSSAMNITDRDVAGIEPLKEAMNKISQISSISDLQTLLAKDFVVQSPFFNLSSFANFNNSEINSAYIGPSNLGLPDRDYYILKDHKSKQIRQDYLAFIADMLHFLGDSQESALEQAKLILKFETRLAIPRLDKVELRDRRKLNNVTSIKELEQMVSQIDWRKLMDDIGVATKVDTLIVTQPKYMKVLNEIFAENNLSLLKMVVRWATLNGSAGSLSSEVERRNWEFYGKTLRGVKEQRPLKERVLQAVNGSIGEALGKLYVDKKFPPEAKVKAKAMVENTIKAFKKRIAALHWMDEQTKMKAIEKLEKLTIKIGYPDQWEDYSKMNIERGNSYFENLLAISQWAFRKNISEINQPVDKTKWFLPPQVVNAYYNPSYNEIVFPAAILQPPFYNYQADQAVNYGGIGAVIGHEISHAFDDAGSRFDSNGNLSNWWTEEDQKKFAEKNKVLSGQFNKIEVLDSVFINGEFTLGENIGDLGGVLGAYDGLQMYFQEAGRPDNIDGFTPEQRFFISWVTIWRSKIRDKALRAQILTDPHSPGKVRAVQPLKNVDAFYKAFDIQKGDKMYLPPEERARIW